MRELEILALVAKGYTNKEIAARLSLANTTVRTHLTKIFRKIAVRRRTEAAVKYLASSAERMIDAAIDHMLNHINQPLRISSLSRISGVSSSHFYVLFKSITGHSPIDFLIKLRMHRACNLLQIRDLKIKEISTRVGYGDPQYFSRIFKSVVGVTPHEYRNTTLDSSHKKSGLAPVNFHATRFSSPPQFMSSRTTFKHRNRNGVRTNRTPGYSQPWFADTFGFVRRHITEKSL